MNIVFRVDSSTQLGIGHIMRCLTLADVLNEKGCQVSFLCRKLPGNACKLVANKGYRIHYLPCNQAPEFNGNNLQSVGGTIPDAKATAAFLKGSNPVEWIIVDHYALDWRWEKFVRSYSNRLMVVDDLADRKHDCDLLLDQNLYEGFESRYENLVDVECIKLLGINYTMLRPEFLTAREQLSCRDTTVRRILIFYGGSDPTNETVKALDAIRLLEHENISVDVVIGETNTNKAEIRYACNTLKQVSFHCQVNNIAQLMAKADLSLGAVGSATWERFCLGLPTITTIIADNQRQLAIDLARRNLIFCLGDHRMVTSQTILHQLSQSLASPDKLQQMRRNTMALVDGKGVNRVANHILNA